MEFQRRYLGNAADGSVDVLDLGRQVRRDAEEMNAAATARRIVAGPSGSGDRAGFGMMDAFSDDVGALAGHDAVLAEARQLVRDLGGFSRVIMSRCSATSTSP